VLLPYPIAIGFQNICSLLCASSFKAVVLAVVALVSRRKLAVVVFITFFIINVYLNTLSKLLFSDPRPFWFSTDILQLEWKCPGQFGNPSGHSRSAALFYYLIINDFIAKYGRPGCGWWAAIVCVWVLVPLSRLALGAHSSNQVLFGMLLGLAWLVFYRFGLQ
jgi:membrane-associated phospholipid phosphatase